MSSAVFSHSNFTSNCIACHEIKRPTTTSHLNLAGASLVTNNHYVPQDCVTCHTAGTTWKFSHNPAQTSCNSCHETKRPAAPHAATGDCISCHITSNWTGVNFVHDSSITSCVSCHETKRPSNTKHLNASGVSVVSTPHYTSQDCVRCHTAGVTWAFTHSPSPSSCTSCHEIKRPAVVNGVTHVATGDCKGCHNITNWTATFNHSPTPTSCNSCHNATRPATQSHLNTLDVKVVTTPHYTTQDCVACHSPTSGTAILPSAWSFQHNPLPSTCSTCHEIKRPVAPHVATGDCKGCHTILNWTSATSYNHSPVPASCLSCHTSTRPTTNTSHNSKVTNHYSTIQECKSCHTTPTSTKAMTWKSGSSLSCVLCHLSKGIKEHGSSANSGGSHSNCANCHSPTKSKW
jgi:predicted CXXCH cytochrome family protein